MARKRSRNFHMPCEFEVSSSVDGLVELARRVANKDHRESFETDKERDMIASVYLNRATDRLKDET